MRGWNFGRVETYTRISRPAFRASRPPIQRYWKLYFMSKNRRDVRLTNHLHLMLRLRMSWAAGTPVWLCGVHRYKFTCKFTLRLQNVYTSRTTEL